MKLLNVTAGFILVSLIVFILHFAKALILPFVIALVIWYVILEFTRLFQRIPFGKKYLPFPLCLALSIIISSALFYLFVDALTSSMGNIINEAPQYQAKLKETLDYLNQWTGNHLNTTKLLGNVNLASLFSTLAVVISNLLGNFTLVLIYLLFLALEANTFDSKLKGLCASAKQYQLVNKLLTHITQDINKFLQTKIIINSIAGFSSYIVLKYFGIDYAEFWGMLIFLLHFIPFIGTIIAVLVVMLAISIQMTSLLMFGVLGSILIAIQFLVGNVLEPKIMGTRLNLSPLVILLSLAFWGYIWGILGMFLCVPLMVIINIIFAHFPKTRFVAVMLSANPEAVKISRVD